MCIRDSLDRVSKILLERLALEQDLGDAVEALAVVGEDLACLLYTSPSPRDRTRDRMPYSA